MQPFPLTVTPKDGAGTARSTHLDGTLQLRPLEAQPHHADDRQGHAQPIEEAEEVDDGEDISGEGVHQSHNTLKPKTEPREPGRAVLMRLGECQRPLDSRLPAPSVSG